MSTEFLSRGSSEFNIGKENEPAIQINIAILPDEIVRDEAIRLSEVLKNFLDVHFVLNPKNLMPHITISQARYPEKNLGNVIDVVRRQATSISPFDVQLLKFDLFFNQFIFWNAERTRDLVDFHQQIVDATNSLREGRVIEHVATMTDLSPEDESDRTKYGALLIGPRYKPHVTLTRLKQPASLGDVVRILGSEKPATFNIQKVIVGYLGNHGTVNGVIEEIPLG